MWFADKLGPAPRNTAQARADGSAKTAPQAKGGKVAPPQRAAAPPQAARRAPAPEEPKKKKGWF